MALVKCSECGKEFKNKKCLNCGYEEEIENELNNKGNAESKLSNSSVNRGNTNFIVLTLKTTAIGLLLWGIFNYFVFGDIFGTFGSKGKIIDTTWKTGYGELTFFKGGKCELYNLGPVDTCTWKLDGNNVTIKYTYKSVSGEIKGKFNENFTRFSYE